MAWAPMRRWESLWHIDGTIDRRNARRVNTWRGVDCATKEDLRESGLGGLPETDIRYAL
jgi:hypothetical protein